MPSSLATAAAVRALSPVSMIVCRPSPWSSARTRAASGRGWSARRIQPSGPDRGRQGDGRADRRPRPCPSSAWNVGLAEARLVDVAVAAEVILDGVDPAQRAHAGDGAVVVGDRDVEPQVAGVAGDGLAQDVPAAVAQRGRDPQHLVLVVLAGRADDLDDVGLAERQGPRLVERQGAEPADLLEELAPLDQDAAPRRGRQAADDRHGRGDHQGARAGDHQHHQPLVEPVVPERPAGAPAAASRPRRAAAGPA